MTVRPVVAEIPDKKVRPVIEFIKQARRAGLVAEDADSDLLIMALIRASVEEE